MHHRKWCASIFSAQILTALVCPPVSSSTFTCLKNNGEGHFAIPRVRPPYHRHILRTALPALPCEFHVLTPSKIFFLQVATSVGKVDPNGAATVLQYEIRHDGFVGLIVPLVPPVPVFSPVLTIFLLILFCSAHAAGIPSVDGYMYVV